MTNSIKELKGLIVSILSVLALFGVNQELALKYMYLWNIHIMAMMFFGSYLSYYFMIKQTKSLRNDIKEVLVEQQTQITTILTQQTQDNIKARIEQAYRDYKDIEFITFETSIELIYGLEEERITAKLNSRHERMMQKLIKKIKG